MTRLVKTPELVSAACILWNEGCLTVREIASEIGHGVTEGMIKGWAEKDRVAFPAKDGNARRGRARNPRVRTPPPVANASPSAYRTEVQFAEWVIRKKEWPVQRLDQNGVPAGFVKIALSGGMVPAPA